MADEVEITNVGNGGDVASEETLARLADSIGEFAKKSGMDPKAEAAKVQKAHTKTLEEDVEAIRKKIKAQEEYTDVLKRSTRTISGMFMGTLGLLTSGLGLVTGGLLGFAETILDGDNSLSGLVSNFPVFGSVLARFAGIIDNTYDALSLMAQSGGAFNYSLEELRVTAANSRISLEDFAAMIEQSSENLAAFGGTVSNGGRMVSNLVDTMDSDLRKQLIAMGLNYEDINDQMATYLYLDRAGSRARIQSEQMTAEAAASLTKNMLTLAKLTGKDIKQQQEKIAQAQMDMAFQREMAKLGPEERRKLTAAMTEAQAQGGEVAVNALKAEFLGMPPLTEELAIYTATQTESAMQIKSLLDQALDSSVNLDQFQAGQGERMANYLESQLRAGNRLDEILKVAAVSGEGMPAEIARQFGQSAELLGSYMKDTGDGLVFAREEFLNDYNEGKFTPPADSFTNAIAEFKETVSGARIVIEENLISPFAENVITPALNNFTGWLNGFVDDNGEGSSLQNAFDFINGKITSMGNTIGTFLEQFKADPEQAVSNLVDDIGNFFRDAIFGKEIAINEGPEFYKERQGGLIEAMRNGIAALFADDSVLTALTNGITDITTGFLEGFTAFWNDPESQQLRDDISKFFEDVLDSFSNLIREKIGGFGGSTAGRQTTQSLSDRFMAGEELDLEERQDLINTLRAMQREQDGTGAVGKTLGFLSGAMSDLVGNLDARTSSDEAIRKSIKALELNSNTDDTNLIEVPEYNQGTKGFENFGSGTLAMLHGMEAVIPLDSPLGSFLNKLNSSSSPEILDSFKFNTSDTLQQTFDDMAPDTQMLEGIAPKLQNIFDSIVPNTGSLEGIAPTLQNIFNSIVPNTGLLEGISPTLQNIFDSMAPDTQMLEGISPELQNIFNNMMPDTQMLESIGPELQDSFNNIMPDTRTLEEVDSRFNENLINEFKESLREITTNSKSDLESLMNNVNETLQNTTANQGNSEAMQELNSTMMQVLAVLRQTKTIDERIEKNTSSMGGNIANGRVSNIR